MEESNEKGLGAGGWLFVFLVLLIGATCGRKLGQLTRHKQVDIYVGNVEIVNKNLLTVNDSKVDRQYWGNMTLKRGLERSKGSVIRVWVASADRIVGF